MRKRKMSEVKQVECDRCHSREESPGVVGGQIMRPPTWKFVDNKDLCPDCYISLKAWFRNKDEE